LAKNRAVAPDLSYATWQAIGRGKLTMPEMERLAAIIKTYGWHAALVRPVFHNPETNWELTVVHKEKVGAPADSAA